MALGWVFLKESTRTQHVQLQAKKQKQAIERELNGQRVYRVCAILDDIDSINMKLVGIDPGLINVGWAIVENGKLITCGVFNMTHKVPVKERKQYARLVKRFMRFKMFRDCDVVVIRQQMSGKLRVVANSFLCFNWGKSYLVSPRAVRNHHGISMSNYRANKRASVAKVPRYMTSRQTTRFRAAKKRDDMADAILIAMYWYQTSGEQDDA